LGLGVGKRKGKTKKQCSGGKRRKLPKRVQQGKGVGVASPGVSEKKNEE